MKQSVKKIALLVVVLALCFGTATTAFARSSAYLFTYKAWLKPVDNGQIKVAVDVQARDDMDEVGASEIQIWESKDGGDTFDPVRIYVKSLYPEMFATNTYYYDNFAVIYDGTPGYQYYAIITIYAGDSTGSDSRVYKTTTVTAVS